MKYRVYPVLLEVYTSVVGLHILLFIKVLVLPQFCVNIWGVEAMVYSILLPIFRSKS